MKTAVIASPLIASENLNGSVMGMDASGMSQATYFMRDKIYSDKILAVVREYACNAIDEHLKHGIKDSVKIGLRQQDENIEFFVRDFANGLSDHDIRNVFGMYFRSTKSGTNESIGGFGIGSKAGHCYNDTFFVTSYFQGKKSTYACMLGGGDTGVPVGHIYEIDSCDTLESGLEVSINIQRSDIAAFEEKINNFIKYSPRNITQILLDESVKTPNKTIVERQINEFNFRLVESQKDAYSMHNPKPLVLQMGGVSYGSFSIASSGYNVKQGYNLIVDVPIGSMSIPLSRESFEDTPNNNKIIERIKEIVLDMAQKDLEKFKDKTILNLIEDNLSGLYNLVYSGEIFSSTKAVLFKSFWSLASHIKQSNAGSDLQKNQNKIQIVVIPQNSAQTYWINKLINFSKITNRNYYFALECYCNNLTTDVLNEVSLVRVKKLDYPRVKPDLKRYSISNNRTKCGSFSPLELHNRMASQLSLETASNEKEAKIQTTKYISDLQDTKQLLNFVIANRNIFSKDERKIGFYCNSQKFVDAMAQLGWLSFRSAEYNDIYKKLLEKEKAKREFEIAVIDCNRRWLDFNTRTQKLIQKNTKNALRIQKFWQEVRKENSLRSNIIMSFDNAGYSCAKYSRNQFRSIMKIK